MLSLLGSRARDGAASLVVVWRNHDLRRLGAAALLAGVSGFGYAVALFVWAFDSAGAAGAGLVGTIVLAPAAVLAPFAALVGDRMSRRRVLMLTAGCRALLLAGTAAAMELALPLPAVLVLAALAGVPTRLYYPTQAALVPSLARDERELSAANALGGALENVAILAGPAIAGVLLVVAPPAVVVALAASASGAVTALVAGIRDAIGHTEADALRHWTRQLGDGFASIARSPALSLVVAFYGFQTIVFATLSVGVVQLAITDLGLGAGGVGLLTAMIGAGGIVGGLVSVSLAGRASLGRGLRTATIAWALPLALIPFVPLPATLALLACTGCGNVIVDITVFTLLQRHALDEVRARVFGALEGIAVLAASLGTAAGGAAVEQLGVHATLITDALALTALTLVLWRRIGALDTASRAETHVGAPSPATA